MRSPLSRGTHEGRPRPGGNVAVAGGVDDDVRGNRLPAGLGLHDHAGDARAVQHRPDDPAMQAQRDALFLEQVERGDLGRLGIEADAVRQIALGHVVLGLGIRIVLGDAAQPHQFRDVVRRDALDRLQGLGRPLIAKAVVAGHQPGRAVAAEEGIPLDQQRARPAAGGRRRGDDAARPAARDDDLILSHNRRLQTLRIGFGAGLSARVTNTSGHGHTECGTQEFTTSHTHSSSPWLKQSPKSGWHGQTRLPVGLRMDRANRDNTVKTSLAVPPGKELRVWTQHARSSS